jgi:Domain of unknown function (DUF4136)
MKSFRIITAAAVLAIATVAPVQAKVDVIQSPSRALASGSTFAWAPVPAQGFGIPDPAVANEITAGRLRAVTEITLRAKGFRQVSDPSAADLLVAYTIVIIPEIDARLTSDRMGCVGPFCGGASSYDLDAKRYSQGTLVLDLIERESGRLVWRATSEKRVTGKDVTQQKLAALLKQMTKSLPAQINNRTQ